MYSICYGVSPHKKVDVSNIIKPEPIKLKHKLSFIRIAFFIHIYFYFSSPSSASLVPAAQMIPQFRNCSIVTVYIMVIGKATRKFLKIFKTMQRWNLRQSGMELAGT